MDITTMLRPLAPLLAIGLLAGADNLLRDGDFERPFTSITDLGASWGTYAIEGVMHPECFTRDTTNPHGGAACLRLFRPGGPQPWSHILTTSAENSLKRPLPGRRYTLSFWGRSDRPGRAVVRIQSWRDAAGTIAGPVIAIQDCDLDASWSRHEVSFVGEWDFRTADTDCIYPILLPAVGSQAQQDRTVWIDDVALTDEPADPRLRVEPDPARLAIPTIPSRFTPGPALAATVSILRTLGSVNHCVGGLSISGLNRWNGPLSATGSMVAPDSLVDGVRDLHLPMSRVYGLTDHEFDGGSLESALDHAVMVLDRFGIPRDTSIIEPEPVHANTRLCPEDWRRLVAYAKRKNLGIRHWEIGNEVWVSTHGREHGGQAFATADDYVRHVVAVSQAIKSVQPDALVGISILSGHIQWCDRVLSAAAGHYDFVCPHLYDFTDLDGIPFEEAMLAGNHSRLAAAQTINALLRACNPGRDVFIYDSEWGLHADARIPAWKEPRNAGTHGTLYRAIRLIHYVREGLVRGASGWALFGSSTAPGFMALARTGPDHRTMMSWLYHHLNRHLGDRVLDLEGTAPCLPATSGGHPLTPMLATIDASGDKLMLIVANASASTSFPASIAIPGFRPVRVHGTLLRHDDLNASPVVTKDADFVRSLPATIEGERITFTMPSHGIAFLTLSR